MNLLKFSICTGSLLVVVGCSTIQENLAMEEVKKTCVDLVHSGKLRTSTTTKNGTEVFADSLGGCYLPNGNYFSVTPLRS